MRFEEVRAVAFGPFTDQCLELAPGMNIIFGANESGKSTWHAALYLGLCGIRRKQGRLRKEDQILQERHKPWDSDAWKTRAVVVLEDGRRIEIANDLLGRVDCKALEVGLGGRDCSTEILNEGSPDGSKWLGLDRRSFLVTACIRQGEMLEVANSGELLQEHLQRAAATAGTDATAAEALRSIEEFFSEAVGLDRSNSSKPLPAARKRNAQALADVALAKEEHRRYEELAFSADEIEHTAEEARHTVSLLEARRAQQESRALASRLEEAEALLGRLPEKPPDALHEDQLANDVAAALERWTSRSLPAPLEGPASEELIAEMDSLPEMPPGHTETDPTLLQLEIKLRELDTRCSAHEEVRPALEDHGSDLPDADRETLVELAKELSLVVPSRAVAEPTSAVAGPVDSASAKRRQAKSALVAAGVLALTGVVLMMIGYMVPGVVVFGCGLLAATFSMMNSNVGSAGSGAAVDQEKLHELEASVVAADERLASARQRATALGVPLEPSEIHDVIARLDRTVRHHDQLERWQSDLNRLQTARQELIEKIEGLLSSFGSAVDAPCLEAIQTYKAECQERARIAKLAGRKLQLAEVLESRRTAEQVYAKAIEEATEAEDRLREVAERCLIVRDDTEELVDALQGWQERRVAELEKRQQDRDEWQRLEALLDGATLQDLRDRANRAHSEFEKYAEGLDLEEVAALHMEEDPEGQLRKARIRASDLENQANQARGQLQERAQKIPSVAEAEEELAQASQEWERVRVLERTLTATREYLQAAQDNTHRSIAPVLEENLEQWLPLITGGRYVDASVDPASLSVKVRATENGSLRDAALLSHGTAEQIFLLLRVALAEHLTSSNERCPLFLDDVTVQSDSTRKKAILEALHKLSTDRQIILFTQEEEVLTWGKENLEGPDHRIQMLDASSIQA